MAEGNGSIRDLKFLTFDLYGTVVDMQGGLPEAATVRHPKTRRRVSYGQASLEKRTALRPE